MIVIQFLFFLLLGLEHLGVTFPYQRPIIGILAILIAVLLFLPL